jgi:WhiB family redox-sensing transcriptional regulator
MRNQTDTQGGYESVVIVQLGKSQRNKMIVQDRDAWMLQAKCSGMGDALFPETTDQRTARALCSGCPVRSACLAEALENRIEWGIWGGMTERERRSLLRRRPDVTSWRSLLLDVPQAV